MDQDDLEDELIWKTVVAHFDMASEKISYRLRGALGNTETLIAITLGAIVVVGWVLRSSREERTHDNIQQQRLLGIISENWVKAAKTDVSDAFRPCFT